MIERRQFLDAWCAPGCPEIHQHRLAGEIGQARFASVGIVERRLRRRLALVAAVDALDRPRLGGRRGLVRRLLLGLLAAGKREESARDQEQTHGRRPLAQAAANG